MQTSGNVNRSLPNSALLSIEKLSVYVQSRIRLLDQVSLNVQKGEVVALIGESGSGKTTLAQAIGQIYLPSQKVELEGSVRFRGDELVGLSESSLRKYRGRHIGYVFQDPYGALNPIQPIGMQIAESLTLRSDISFDEAFEKSVQIMENVFLPHPRELFWRYPHELSGGMRQRVVIAAVALLKPDLIIADEPTSALDAALQQEIMEILLKEVRSDHSGLLIVTHDFSLVESIASKAYVLDHGKVIEEGTIEELLRSPKAPKTQALVSAYRRLQCQTS